VQHDDATSELVCWQQHTWVMGLHPACTASRKQSVAMDANINNYNKPYKDVVRLAVSSFVMYR